MPWGILLVTGALLLLAPTAYAGFIGAPYAPTRIAAVKRAFDIIGLGPDDIFVDLGVGDGRIVKEAAGRGARAIGYELSPIMWVMARLRTWRQPRVSVRYGNFYKQPLGDATVIYTFLMPAHMARLQTMLANQPLPKARYFLSYAFHIADVPPRHIVRAPRCAPLFIYEMSDVISGQGGEPSAR